MPADYSHYWLEVIAQAKKAHDTMVATQSVGPVEEAVGRAQAVGYMRHSISAACEWIEAVEKGRGF